MIKFFRKIRKDFLFEGNTRKYLKYAIGEIVLVVIGILIALQINNWNQKEKLRDTELETLKSLLESTKINLAELNYIHEVQIRRNKSLEEVLFMDISDRPLVYLDSIITENVSNYTFDPSTGIYNSIINSGTIEIITNDSLKNKISRLNDIVADYQESEDEVTEYTRTHLEESFINNMEIDPKVIAKLKKRTEAEQQKDRANYIKSFNSQRLKNMYILLLKKMRAVIVKGRGLKSQYEILITDLENEIKRIEE
jgi:hypothetical protein